MGVENGVGLFIKAWLTWPESGICTKKKTLKTCHVQPRATVLEQGFFSSFVGWFIVEYYAKKPLSYNAIHQKKMHHMLFTSFTYFTLFNKCAEFFFFWLKIYQCISSRNPLDWNSRCAKCWESDLRLEVLF